MSRRIVLAGLTTAVVAARPSDTQVLEIAPADLTVEAVTQPVDGQRPDCTVVILGPGAADPFAVVHALQRTRSHIRTIVVGGTPTAGIDPLGLIAGRHIVRVTFDQLSELDAIIAEQFAAVENELRYQALRATAQAQLTASNASVQRRVGERLFGEMLSRAPISVVLTDLAGHIVAWNERAGQLLDLTDPESVNHDVTQLFDDPAAVASHLGFRPPHRMDVRMSSSFAGDPVSIFGHTRANNSVVHLRLTGQRVTDDAGIARLLVIAEDVTETVEDQRQIMRHSRQSLTAAEVAAAMTATGPLGQALGRCSNVIATQLGFAAAGIWLHHRDRDELSLEAMSGPADDILRSYHDVATGDGPVRRAGVERDPIITEPGSVATAPWLDHSFAAYPLISGDELVGVLGVLHSGPFAPDSLASLPAMARQIAVGIRQSLLHQQTVTVAEALQKPLLPPTLPAIRGLDLAARYQAHGDSTRIGGDFYDVFELSDGRHAVVLGDVCGKGPEAAAVTGLVRHTIWTAAQHRAGADYVLPLVNRALLRVGDARFCTLTYGVLDVGPAGVTVHLTCAGHPPPVVYQSGRTRLSTARGTLLGATRRLNLHAETVALSPGDALVCYTDGFTEGGGSHDQRQPSDVAADIAGIISPAPVSASVVADALLARTLTHIGTSLRDDLALLVIAVPPLADATANRDR